MPAGDRTGPSGRGPRTGLGLGPCGINNLNPVRPLRRFFGGLFGRGRGRGGRGRNRFF